MVSGVAFSCSTEFLPELNEKLRLVPFTMDFKLTLTVVMVLDYMGCYVIEQGLKRAFSDLKPKDIAVRREEQLQREEKRKREEWEARQREIEKAAGKDGN